MRQNDGFTPDDYRSAPNHGQDWLSPFAASIQANGWAVTGPVIALPTLAAIAATLAEAPDSDGRGGRRNLLDISCVRDLAQSMAVRAAASSILGSGCFAVRGLLFDKQPEANWRVPWHQDLTIAVQERHEIDSFGPWSLKAGVHHVQAPPELLKQMLAVRIHLDDCGPNNGPLRLLPNSHRAGVLQSDMIETWVAEHVAELGLAEAGSILAFRPLLLHSSSSATHPAHRRVVHLEFAAFDLPDGLEWRWRV